MDVPKTDQHDGPGFQPKLLSERLFTVTNYTKQCRPPSHLPNRSPPSDNKSPTWSNRFLHKLTVVAHPARLQQLHLCPELQLLVRTKKPPTLPGDQFTPRTIAERPFFVSNSVRYFAFIVTELHPCGGHLPEDKRLAAALSGPDDKRGNTRRLTSQFPLL